MMRFETNLTRCNTWSCNTTVDLDDDPERQCACGAVTCRGCVTHECGAA